MLSMAGAAAMAKLTFETGDRLCAQSEPCDTLYVVMSGQFSTKRGTLRLAHPATGRVLWRRRRAALPRALRAWPLVRA